MAGDIKLTVIHEYDQHNSESRNILIYTRMDILQQHYLFDDTKNPDIRNIKNLVDIW